MATPRRVLPGSTYFVTRRCFDRRHFLRPSTVVRKILLYALAVAARRFGVEIHSYAFMSSRVDPGRCRPGPPTDPDVRNSRIRLLALVGSLRATKDGAHRGRRWDRVAAMEHRPPRPRLPGCG